MKLPKPLTIALVSATAIAGFTVAARAQEADFSFFYDSLSPYGNWVEVGEHGACWLPAVEEGWAPYTKGNWAYTDVGWTWVSHEPFGSIVFHYGRWLLTSDGWAWVPGSDWAPAWVSWRVSNEYVGWAAVPPGVPWHSQRGVGTWVDVHSEIGPGYYRFCLARDFGAPRLSGVLLRPTKNITVMFGTQNVTNIFVYNEGVYCGGPQYRWLRERSSYTIPVLRVCREESVDRFYGLNIGGNFGTVQGFISNDILVLPAPRRVELNGARSYRMPEAGGSVSRGWYSDSNSNERLRAHFESEWEARGRDTSRQGRDAIKADVLVRPAAAEERRAVLWGRDGVGADAAAPRRVVPGAGSSGAGSTKPAERPGATGQQPLLFERSSNEPSRGVGGDTPVPRVVPVYPSRSSESGKPLSTPGIITERGVIPLDSGITIDRGGSGQRSGTSERTPQVLPREPLPPTSYRSQPREDSSRAIEPPNGNGSASGRSRREGEDNGSTGGGLYRSGSTNAPPTPLPPARTGFPSVSQPREPAANYPETTPPTKLRTLPNDAAGFVAPRPPASASTGSTAPQSSQGAAVNDSTRTEGSRREFSGSTGSRIADPSANMRSAPVVPQSTPQSSGASYRSGGSIAAPQTMPSSRATSTVTVPSQQGPVPTSSTDPRGGGPSGGSAPSLSGTAPSSPSSGAPAGRAPASQSSGATLSTGAASPNPATTPAATKKKPGDPGYVPGMP
ncbi:MAG: DUF6600 domain-containing protein [Verrucomicrobiota bacterium]